MEQLLHYFPELTENQIEQFRQLKELYTDWNSKINVISRKDMDNFYEKHVLHSLAIAKVIQFKDNTKLMDIGTGGGFPGIPLAILFPNCEFHLVDSIGKKIKVVEGVSQSIKLKNLTFQHTRAEQVDRKFDFVISRAVTQMETFTKWVKNSFNRNSFNELPNGILYLKGGDLTEELKGFPSHKQFSISEFYSEEFFETKKVVYLKRK